MSGESYFERLRQHALSFPGAWEDHPWEDTVFKNAKGKIFLFCGEPSDGRVRATVKLEAEEGEEALSLPFVRMAPYVGRFGWVQATASDDFEFETLLAWVG